MHMVRNTHRACTGHSNLSRKFAGLKPVEFLEVHLVKKIYFYNELGFERIAPTIITEITDSSGSNLIAFLSIHVRKTIKISNFGFYTKKSRCLVYCSISSM